MRVEAEELEERLARAHEETGAGTNDALVRDTRPPTEPSTSRADERPEPRLTLLAGAGVLASLGAASMCGGLFRDALFARSIAALGVGIGAGLTFLSLRRRTAALQALVVPVAALAGGALVAPAASGGTANLPSLVAEALRDGGLLQPPVAFAPGWRFIVVVLMAVVASASLGLAVHLRRARVALAIPVAVVVGASLLQPKGAGFGSVAVAGALVLGALALAYGADLPVDQSLSGAFESRRLARGAGLVAALLVALALVSRAGFLFPTTDQERVVPPQRPPAAAPEPDRVLFHVDSETKGPWRIGVLDSYDGEAFLLPPIDPKRVIEPHGGVLKARRGDRATYDVTFRVADLRGAALPIPASAVRVRGGGDVAYDPITEALRRTGGRARRGETYTVTAQAAPDGRQLAAETLSTDALVAAFKDAPPPPNEVVQLLAEAPAAPFDRMQFIRQRLYNNVVAAGGGTPVEVTPARVGALFRSGAEATPYEITAAEVLLARWAGVPARLGFGFYGGETVEGKTGLDFRPKHGAAWLEAWFDGYGWTPLVGTPPKAKAGLNDEDKNKNDNVTASEDLALIVFVPVKLSTIRQVSEQVRYWLQTAVPVIAAVLALAALWPVAAKALRRSRRRRWAMARGPAARIWAAYAELRDAAFDLNIGEHAAPPLEFCDFVDDDDEHSELAWLVTRAIWGDLARDLSEQDAEAAETMARSVRVRVSSAQSLPNRIAAALSLASLTNPYTRDVPDLGMHAARARADWRAALVRPRTALVVVVAAIAVATPVITSQRAAATADTPAQLPPRHAPARIGNYDLVRERGSESAYRAKAADSLVARGAVYTIESGPLVAGSFQVVALRAETDVARPSTQAQLLSAVLSGVFRPRFYGAVKLYELRTPEQQVFAWFSQTTNSMELWVFRADVPDARRLVEQHVAYQLEWSPG